MNGSLEEDIHKIQYIFKCGCLGIWFNLKINYKNKTDNNNACTSVPIVFLGRGKTEFKLPVSFFVYARHRKTEFDFLLH